MTESTQCDECKKPIDEKLGYVEKEVTDWVNETEGQSTTYYFHRECEVEV